MSSLTRRLRRVGVTGEFFVDVMKCGWPAAVVVENRLPDDATYVGATWDPIEACVWLLVTSAEFDEVPQQAVIPVHPPVMFQREAMGHG
jgi:hypothetical protein